MKAVVVREFANFDKAEVGEIPDPQPGEGDVVVDLEASEANYPDILLMEGAYQKKPPLPFTPGLAGAGRISQAGSLDLAGLIHQRVLVFPEYGSHAEKVVAPAAWCFPIPDDLPSDEAAALGLVYQTAYFALVHRARFMEGDAVLVLGATGGVGMAAVQLAKALGATKVIAATRGKRGAAIARGFGADVVIDSGMADLRDGLQLRVKEATGGNGVDIVIDPVGGDLSAAALRTMAWGGRLVVVGFASGSIPRFAANYLLVKNIEVSGLQWTDYRSRQPDYVRKAQAHLFDLWAAGKLSPRITARLPLERFVEALAELKAASANGKIVLTMGNDHRNAMGPKT